MQTIDRSRSYKKGIDADRSRRSRLETTIQISKKTREEGLQKRHAMAAVSLPAADDVPSMVNDENNNTNDSHLQNNLACRGRYTACSQYFLIRQT